MPSGLSKQLLAMLFLLSLIPAGEQVAFTTQAVTCAPD